MTLDDVLDIISKEKIKLEWLDLQYFKGIYAKAYDHDIIIINNNICDIQEIKNILLHELGHYFTGTIYTKDMDRYYINKCEYKAIKWVVTQIMPLEKIKEAVQHGIIEVWELAEYFDLPEELIIFRLNLPDIKELTLLGG